MTAVAPLIGLAVVGVLTFVYFEIRDRHREREAALLDEIHRWRKAMAYLLRQARESSAAVLPREEP